MSPTWRLEDAEAHLLSLELFGMRFGLERMRRLLTALSSPQEAYSAVHVVGTNGKSSTVRMCAALLEAHGVRAGAFTSPHLGTFAERIRIGDADLGGNAFGAAVQRAAAAAAKVDRTLEPGDRVTQFELVTAAAFAEFARRGVEVAVVEAGLGGRHDATNVLGARTVVLTNVDLEHTRWLGPTIRDIAREKLAVVQPHATLVIGDLDPDALDEVRRTPAAAVLAAGHDPAVGTGHDPAVGTGHDPAAGDDPAVGAGHDPAAGDDPAAGTGHDPAAARALPGYQRANFALAAAAARAHVGTLDDRLVADVAARISVPGRLQRVDDDPLTIYDGAHNPSGMEALARALPETVGERRTIAVVSILDDKDAAGMLRALLGNTSGAVFTRSRNPRALPPATLASLAAQLGGPPSEIVTDPRAAVARARTLAGADGAVLATGSIYLVADLLAASGSRRRSAL